MKLLYTHAVEEDFNVLYIHSKGVTKPWSDCVKDWIDYMLYFNIDKFQTCLELLQEYDAVGVNLQDKPVLHFSGNFWWSKSSNIRKLGEITNETYHGPEFYITGCKDGKYKGLYISNVNHYMQRFPSELYTQK